MNMDMPPKVRAIRKLLTEQDWIKFELANLTTSWGASREDYDAVRFELMKALLRVKKELHGYTAEEIQLAENWHRQLGRREALRKSWGISEPDEPQQKTDTNDSDMVLRILLFFYLLAKDHQLSAFLTLAMGCQIGLISHLIEGQNEENSLSDEDFGTVQADTRPRRKPRVI